MTLYLFLQIKPVKDILFCSPLVSQFKEEIPDLMVFEADNHSDDFLLSKGQEFISCAERFILHFDVVEGEHPGRLANLLKSISNAKKSVKCFVYGENQPLNNILKLMCIDID